MNEVTAVTERGEGREREGREEEKGGRERGGRRRGRNVKREG